MSWFTSSFLALTIERWIKCLLPSGSWNGGVTREDICGGANSPSLADGVHWDEGGRHQAGYLLLDSSWGSNSDILVKSGITCSPLPNSVLFLGLCLPPSLTLHPLTLMDPTAPSLLYQSQNSPLFLFTQIDTLNIKQAPHLTANLLLLQLFYLN